MHRSLKFTKRLYTLSFHIHWCLSVVSSAYLVVCFLLLFSLLFPSVCLSISCLLVCMIDALLVCESGLAVLAYLHDCFSVCLESPLNGVNCSNNVFLE